MKKETKTCTPMGEKITVACKKGCVFLNEIGTAPFAVVETKRGLAVVPSGYKATSYSDGEYWRGETKVAPSEDDENEMIVYYRFTSDRETDVSSDWKLTPTEAYKECNDRLKTGFSGASNGQLIIGVTYPSLQAKVFAALPEAVEVLNRANITRTRCSESRKRRRPSARIQRRKRVSSEMSDSSSLPSTDDNECCSDSLPESIHETEISDYQSEYDQQDIQQCECEEKKEDEELDLQMVDLNRCFSLHTVQDSAAPSFPFGEQSFSEFPEPESYLSELEARQVEEHKSFGTFAYPPIFSRCCSTASRDENNNDLVDFLVTVTMDDI